MVARHRRRAAARRARGALVVPRDDVGGTGRPAGPVGQALSLLLVVLASVGIPLTLISVQVPGSERLEEEVRRLSHEALLAVESRTGLDAGDRITVTVAPGEGSFRGEVGTEVSAHALAVAFPHEGRIVIRGRRLRAFSGNDLNAALRHEIGHVVLHRSIPGALPSWWDEGVCEWVAGAGRASLEDLELRRRAWWDSLIPLASLDRMPREAGEARLAYRQAGALVDHVERRAGQGSVRQVLVRQARGMPLQDALEEVTGFGPTEHLETLREELAASYSLLEEVARLVSVPVFWALLCVAAFVRHRWRRRRLLDELEEGEPVGEGSGPGPPPEELPGPPAGEGR